MKLRKYFIYNSIKNKIIIDKDTKKMQDCKLKL